MCDYPLSMINTNCDDMRKIVNQVAFADDIMGIGDLKRLKEWWLKVNDIGPKFGYYPEPTKSWLIVKKEQLHLAEDLFNDTGINITTHGRKHLGASVGSDEFRKEYISNKVQKWVEEIKILSKIAMIDPHSAYIAYTRCYNHKYNFIMRTMKDTKNFL